MFSAINRRTLGKVAAMALAKVAMPMAGALAQDAFPSKPITMIVPYPAGGSTDATARVLAEQLSDELSQPVIVENVGGAGGVVGMRRVADSEADGYTIGLGPASTLTVAQALGKPLPYKPLEDFTPIAGVAQIYTAIASRSTLEVSSLAELVAYAKEHPGEIRYGTSGVGSTQHLSGEYLDSVAGIKMTHVPYKGGNEQLAALLGGHIDIGFGTLNACLPQLSDNKIKLLAVLDSKPYEADGVKVAAATDEVFGFQAQPTWSGVYAPKGVDKAKVKILSDAVTAALKTEKVSEAYTNLGLATFELPADQMKDFLIQDYNFWKKIVDDSNIRISN
jgi:tripartite-type tricarboxylate transporter receptor subunit TctC